MCIIFLKTMICKKNYTQKPGGKEENMRKINGILVLSLITFLSVNMNPASATENTSNSYELSGQSCTVSDNKICLGEDLVKELLKQAIYTAGTKALNMYMNSGTPTQYVPTTPVYTPAFYTPPVAAPVTVPVTTTPTVTITPVSTTTTTANTTTTAAPNQQGDVIIISQ